LGFFLAFEDVGLTAPDFLKLYKVPPYELDYKVTRFGKVKMDLPAALVMQQKLAEFVTRRGNRMAPWIWGVFEQKELEPHFSERTESLFCAY
jgi:hypothetical protein